MYVFSDNQGVNWSALFDNVDVMSTMLRVVVAAVGHVCGHGDGSAAPQSGFVKGLISCHPHVMI